MFGPCWEINMAEIKQRREDKRTAKEADESAEEAGVETEAVTQRTTEPPKNLTPEEIRMIDEAAELAKQFQGEMVLVDTVFTVMKMLEILVDAANFYDLQNDGNWFDAGTFAGKGLINAGFNTYQVAMENFIVPR